MRYSMIAAVSDLGVIGHGDEIPWKAKGEQLLFKAMTYGSTILVGRKTWETLPPLPGRKVCVLSRTLDDPNATVFRSVHEFINHAYYYERDVFIAGGAEIYAEFMPLVDYIHLSRVHTNEFGDKVFPAIPDDFKKVFDQTFRSNIDYTYEIWERE